MNKASIVAQKLSAVLLLLISIRIGTTSWLNYTFVSKWGGSYTELAENNVSLMTYFSTIYWPLTIVLSLSSAVTGVYLFKKNTMPLPFTVSLVIGFAVAGSLVHIMAVSTGFELNALIKNK